MIPERGMWQGKRIDNSEIVKGQLHIVDSKYYISIAAEAKLATDVLFDIHSAAFQIDPSTLEPVAVAPKNIDKCGTCFHKPVFCGECPNCGQTVASSKNYPYELKANDYCGRCGQRINWNANAADVERGERV